LRLPDLKGAEEMRQFFRQFVICLSIFLGMSSAFAAPADDALAVLTSWEKDFNAGNVSSIVGLYTPDATVFGTLNPAVTSGADGIKNYFAASAKNKTQVKFVGNPAVVKISDVAMVLSGIYEFTGTRADGQNFTAPARYSFVVARVDGQWRIIHQHSSPQPKPQ